MENNKRTNTKKELVSLDYLTEPGEGQQAKQSSLSKSSRCSAPSQLPRLKRVSVGSVCGSLSARCFSYHTVSCWLHWRLRLLLLLHEVVSLRFCFFVFLFFTDLLKFFLPVTPLEMRSFLYLFIFLYSNAAAVSVAVPSLFSHLGCLHYVHTGNT